MATFFTFFDLTLALRNLQLGMPLMAMYYGLGCVATAVGAWIVIWLEAKVRLILRELEASVRVAEHAAAAAIRLAESMHTDETRKASTH
jgi:hypothetical protein